MITKLKWAKERGYVHTCFGLLCETIIARGRWTEKKIEAATELRLTREKARHRQRETDQEIQR